MKISLSINDMFLPYGENKEIVVKSYMNTCLM